ncbi:DUF3800 domain-containing protein [Enterococcus faecium]|uniref:DUF3800 domain-containing protein n=1 Tax=Enterococcus TaxID=1350 RepID=UPI000F0C6FD0|nr:MULTISPECIES: DUF3800 domain-containing protein [Enterococcus]AYQ59414.1 DUF3800 domain-containing protein [Enterococcus faecium]EGP5233561.1 DUF3800 domain-containing protein [Enterococcus faecium]EGP5448586.1 DUF3800 domain-containing protein [Enterococcus faecium]EME8127291.1 DUF3800 domain-containing protein [Enterococcus faecium]MCL6148237.1 DUF3800 domain-containing protein [Enterococcus faecium]
MDWNENPCKLDTLKDVDCIFSIDENGNSTLKNAHLFNENNKLFTISGVYIDTEHYNLIRDQLMYIKNKYWTDGLFQGKRVVFHSKEIRKKQGPFNPKIINYDDFKSDLNVFLSELPVKIYSATIDKFEHNNRYFQPYPVYELGVEFIIERFCFDLRRQNKKGIVLLESRGYKEDCLVLSKLKTLLKSGNEYNSEDNFSCICGVYFNPKRTIDGMQSYWPLEISDILSYRIHRFVRTEIEDADFDCIKEKIFGYPDFEGKGLKIFPYKKLRSEKNE